MKVKIIDPLGVEKTFKTKSEAAKFLGVNESSVRKAIKRGTLCKGYKVYLNEDISKLEDTASDFFRYLEEYAPTITTDTKIPNGKHLCISDLHIPFVNEAILLKIIKMIKDNQFVGLHILGDYLDLTSLSSYDFQKTNKGLKLSDEYVIGNFWLDMLTEYLQPNAIKTWVSGNHDHRYAKYMNGSEASKLGSALISPFDALRLKERGFTVAESYPDGYIQLGDIQLIHGIYLNSNHPKTHIQKLRSSCMYGHSHQQLTYSENGLTAYNIGFLADRNAPIFSYTNRFEKANWKEGFAVINYHNNETYVEMVEIKNNCFIYNNKLY